MEHELKIEISLLSIKKELFLLCLCLDMLITHDNSIKKLLTKARSSPRMSRLYSTIEDKFPYDCYIL